MTIKAGDLLPDGTLTETTEFDSDTHCAMAHWGRDFRAIGKIRFLGDGSAAWTKALGLGLDLNARGMGLRMQRFSMLVDNGVIKSVNVEGPGKFEVSDAETMLKQLG